MICPECGSGMDEIIPLYDEFTNNGNLICIFNCSECNKDFKYEYIREYKLIGEC